MQPILPVFLEELRRNTRKIDWRRDQPASQIAVWVHTYDEISANWSKCHKVEAKALIAKAGMKLTDTIVALCELASLSEERVPWVRAELANILADWNHKITQFISDEERSSLSQQKIKESFELVLRKYPKDRIFNRGYAMILKDLHGAYLAIEHLEIALLKGAPVADILCSEVIRALRAERNPSVVRFACYISPWMRNEFGLDWPAFYLHRTIIFSAILRVPAMLRVIDSSILEANCDIDFCVQNICGLVRNSNLDTAAKILRRLADVNSFWTSSLPGTEEARLKMIDTALEFSAHLDDTQDEEISRRVLTMLHMCVPQTLKFWCDAHWRKSVAKRILEVCYLAPSPYRHMIAARFFYSCENYDETLNEFKLYSVASPATRGASTYIDYRSINENGSEISDFWPKLSYKTLQTAPASTEPVIIVAANERYFSLYLRRYLENAAKIYHSGRIHFHVFGRSQQAEELISTGCSIIPQYEVTLSFEEESIVHPFFFATGRFLRLREWCNRFEGPIILTDIDNLWGQSRPWAPSDFLSQKLADADIGLDLRSRVISETAANSFLPGNRYPSADPWHAVWAGKFFLSGSPASKRFANIVSILADRELLRAAKRSADANWFIDQNILCAAYTYAVRQCPDISFVDLSDGPYGCGQHWISNPSVNDHPIPLLTGM
jgi:hypothetical protein